MFFRYIHNLSSTGYWFERALRREVERWKASVRNDKPVVLDFGCGQKPFQALFKQVRCEYLGIDVYPGEKVDIVYDGYQIPLDDNSIDLVFSVSVFEHVANLDLALSEIARVLKPGGTLIGLVPFINHVHGVPFDFHRPTRLGWTEKLRNAFAKEAIISVSPVDTRINCIGNLITAQVNFVLFDLARNLKQKEPEPESSEEKSLNQGAASPEAASKALTIFYKLLKLNPLNFLIGLGCYLASSIPFKRRLEGEITSGYRLVAQKPG